MRKTILSVSALLLASTLSAYTDQEIKSEAKTAIMKMAKTLKVNMKSHMKSGGPVAAVDFCSQQAGNIENSINKSYTNGISVKRISLQYRNSKNAPSADEKEVLQELQRKINTGKKLPPLFIEKLSNNHYKVYKPIFLNKVCLNCHGDSKTLNKAAYKKIKATYPHDKAIGYKAGDLRGAFVAEIIK